MKRGRPREKSKIVYSPVDNTTILPHARKDKDGNVFFSWKDENGVWKKKNCGRGPNWFQKYLQFEAEIIYKDPFVILPEIIPPVIESRCLGKSRPKNVHEFTIKIDPEGEASISSIVPKHRRSVMINWAKELLHNDPRRASQLFAIPYENLIGIGKKENYSLKEIGVNYFKRPELNLNVGKETKKELLKVKDTWNRFVKVVGVNTIKEVDKPKLRAFRDNLTKEYLKKKWSTTWLAGHYERFRRVLNAGIDDLSYPDDLIEVRRQSLAILKVPDPVKKYPPYRIKRQEFYKLLENSTIEEKAMWLLSLNCAYYGVDVANLPLSAIDWDAKTVLFRRSKTGVHRAAILWDETIEYLSQYLESKRSINRTAVFVSIYGCPYAIDRIRKRFIKVREKAGLEHIMHNHFRDSFNSVALKKIGIQNSLDVVMGHKPFGSRESYRDPELVPEIAKEACKVVHDFYFGNASEEATIQKE